MTLWKQVFFDDLVPEKTGLEKENKTETAKRVSGCYSSVYYSGGREDAVNSTSTSPASLGWAANCSRLNKVCVRTFHVDSQTWGVLFLFQGRIITFGWSCAIETHCDFTRAAVTLAHVKVSWCGLNWFCWLKTKLSRVKITKGINPLSLDQKLKITPLRSDTRDKEVSTCCVHWGRSKTAILWNDTHFSQLWIVILHSWLRRNSTNENSLPSSNVLFHHDTSCMYDFFVWKECPLDIFFYTEMWCITSMW